jgi:hypothetical protein
MTVTMSLDLLISNLEPNKINWMYGQSAPTKELRAKRKDAWRLCSKPG